MSLIGGLFSTVVVSLSMMGKNFSVSESYKRNAEELSLCLKNKGIDPSRYGDNALANIELLTLAKAQKLDRETKFFIEDSRILTDFDDNPFVLVKLNYGFGVYSVLSHVFAEMTVSGQGNPYGEYVHLKKKLKYVWLHDYYIEVDPNNYIGLRNKTKITERGDIESLRESSYTIGKKFMEMSDKCNEEYVITNTEHFEYTTVYDDGSRGGGSVPKTPFDSQVWYNSEIPYSWYFKKNKEEFPHNGSGTCGHVALSMLLGYNEFFKCAGYFSDEQSSNYITPAVSNNFGDAVPDIADNFQYDVLNATPASVSWVIKDAAESFLRGKNVHYSHYDRVWEFGSVLEPLDRGFPAILFGWNFPKLENEDGKKNTGCHAIVAYAYHKLSLPSGSAVYELTCHYGWEGEGYQEMVIPLPAFYEQGSIYSLFNESEHVCKGYFLNEHGRTVRCGCGNVLIV